MITAIFYMYAIIFDSANLPIDHLYHSIRRIFKVHFLTAAFHDKKFNLYAQLCGYDQDFALYMDFSKYWLMALWSMHISELHISGEGNNVMCASTFNKPFIISDHDWYCTLNACHSYIKQSIINHLALCVSESE